MPVSQHSTASSEDSTTSPCLLARIDNARIVVTLLKAIAFKEKAICLITGKGFKFTVEDSKCVQAHAYLQENLFQEFAFTEEVLTFGVNLTILTDCLNIFGSSTAPVSLRISCLGYGHPLILMLEDGGVVTRCKINTLEPDPFADFDFKSSPVMNKIIIQSQWLKEAFEDMDTSVEQLSILVSPVSPYLRLSTEGDSGSVDMEYPKDTDIIESFQCEKTQINMYKLSAILPSLKALQSSKKTALRMNERGLLSMQLMIESDPINQKVSFVEYLYLPVEVNINSQSTQ